MTTPSGSGLSTAAVSISAAGDNVVLPASSSGYFIRRIALALASSTTVQFKAGSDSLSGPMTLTALSTGFADQPYFTVDPGEAFIISLGSSVQTGGTIWFSRGPL